MDPTATGDTLPLSAPIVEQARALGADLCAWITKHYRIGVPSLLYHIKKGGI